MIGRMKLVCAWCKREMGTTGGPDDRTSHGICESCKSHLDAATSGVPLLRFLDSLDAPVTLVDDDVRVVYANIRARLLLDKPSSDLERRLGGDVFECENSYLPGGCGKTPNCASCNLRNAVTRCYHSGQCAEGISATIRQRTAQGPVDLEMRISTKRVNDQVLLRIDEISR